MKTSLSLLFLFAASLVFGAEPPVNAAKNDDCACCKEKAMPRKDACPVRHSLGEGGCEAMAKEAAPFSKESIYQLDVKFTDDSGRAFTLGELRGRPVVLNMFFASCGYACPLLVTDMQAIRGRLPAGLHDKAVFVLVSFDVVRDTPAALAQYRAQRALDGQWTLLHGNDDAVRELAALLGVKYKQEADGAFSHSNILTILNPQGEITHQRAGLKGGLDETAAALVAAAQ
jgi:protein SCO1/2